MTDVLLVDNYDSFTYNLYQCVVGAGARCRVVRNDEVTAEGAARLRPRRILISPGPGSPDESGLTLELLAGLSRRVPTLGVCLGHQAIAQVYGARVVRARRPVHGKLSRIRHDGRGVLRGLPNPFFATRYHSLMVDRASLGGTPLVATAVTDDGTVMGVRHRRLPIEGVQFHPESILTGVGTRLIRNFLEGDR